MLKHTDLKRTPWHVVDADNKKRARLNCIAHLLGQIPYKALLPEALELPPRQEDTGYKRPGEGLAAVGAEVVLRSSVLVPF